MTTPPKGQEPEALRLADWLDLYAPGDPHRREIEEAAVELRALHAQVAALTAATAQPVAQQGAAYAELPPRYYLAGGVEKTWDQRDMYDFADRTNALRTQQPAPATQQAGAPACIAGPMQFGGCPECGSRNCVARECTRTVSHQAQAIPGVQWQCGPQASGFTAQAAESVQQAAPQQEVQEPTAWVPYLLDRADGCKGHYAIARTTPAGSREVWNLRLHKWSAFSDEVLTLEQANDLLKTLVIPTALPAPSRDAEDTARLDYMIENRAYVVSDPDACPGYWLHFIHKETGKCWVQCDEHPTPRAAIDAARKQGANHD